MLAGIETLGLGGKERKELQALLGSEGISEPLVLRDHRKRGPIYWSLIFEPAKSAPGIFGLPPLKMVNFKGIYVADGKFYKKTLEDVASKISSVQAISEFSKAKHEADLSLIELTQKLKRFSPDKASASALAESLEEFYNIRYRFTEYSFFFDTITKSVDTLLQRAFRVLGFSESQRQLAYVPDKDTIEFEYLEKKNSFMKKHAQELTISTKSIAFENGLEELMDEFADMNYVNFANGLQTKQGFLEKLLAKNSLVENTSEIRRLKEQKADLLAEMVPCAKEAGISPEFITALFEFAGSLSAWESKARHTWTRLHRVARPLMEEIGKRAAEKGLIESQQQIYGKEIKEIIKIASALRKN